MDACSVSSSDAYCNSSTWVLEEEEKKEEKIDKYDEDFNRIVFAVTSMKAWVVVASLDVSRSIFDIWNVIWKDSISTVELGLGLGNTVGLGLGSTVGFRVGLE